MIVKMIQSFGNRMEAQENTRNVLKRSRRTKEQTNTGEQHHN